MQEASVSTSFVTDYDIDDPQLRAMERTQIYSVEAAALRLDRSVGLSDERATELASDLMGTEVIFVRGQYPGLAGHIVARWFTFSDGRHMPTIMVNPGYSISRTEVLHEVAHLKIDADGTLRGHGQAWRSTFLDLLHSAEADRVRGGFDFYGLSYH
jgi:hypothetical protein